MNDKYLSGRVAMVTGGASGMGRAMALALAEAKAANPQGRLIQPGEIGALAAFLCRDEARGITMQDLTVSAGSLW